MAGEIANSIGSMTEVATLADTDMLEIERPDGSPPSTPNSWWRVTAAKIATYVLGKVLPGSGVKATWASNQLTLEGIGAQIVEITASTTLGLTHANRTIKANSATAINISVPPQSSVAWPADTQIEGWQHGAGAVTFVAGSGVTIRRSSKLTAVVDGQYAPWGLKRIAADEWLLFGMMGSA